VDEPASPVDAQAAVFLRRKIRQRLDEAQPNLLESPKIATARLSFPDGGLEHESRALGKLIF